MKMYEMELEFEVVLGLKEINDFMNLMGFEEKAAIVNQTLTLKQTISFIPNKEYIRKVEKIIKDEYQTDKFEILNCKFKGYKKLLEKNVENQ